MLKDLLLEWQDLPLINGCRYFADCRSPTSWALAPVVYAQGVDDAPRERRGTMAPLRTEGSGWDIAGAVLFFPSDHSRWVTGTTLPVDARLTSVIVGMEPTMTVTAAGLSE